MYKRKKWGARTEQDSLQTIPLIVDTQLQD